MSLYTESALEPAKETLRERSFTRWMSRDLKQATVDFCKNIGLIAIYAETQEDAKSRYLFWHPPQGTAYQVRSGYTRKAFEELNRNAEEAGISLLTLHIFRGREDIYSAVWITAGGSNVAREHLDAYGIGVARKAENGL